MEASVQFVNGLQVQERHLFLFNDLLLIAKARSGGHFKLKDKVRISELWLDAVAVDEVAEGSAVTKSRDTSFVIGWPPSVNLVAIFRYIFRRKNPFFLLPLKCLPGIFTEGRNT